MHLELDLATGRPSACQDVTDGIGCPPTVLLVTLDQFGGDLAHVSCSPSPGIVGAGPVGRDGPAGCYGTRPRVAVRGCRRLRATTGSLTRLKCVMHHTNQSSD